MHDMPGGPTQASLRWRAAQGSWHPVCSQPRLPFCGEEGFWCPLGVVRNSSYTETNRGVCWIVVFCKHSSVCTNTKTISSVVAVHHIPGAGALV